MDRADNNHVTLDIICITQDMFPLVEAIKPTNKETVNFNANLDENVAS